MPVEVGSILGSTAATAPAAAACTPVACTYRSSHELCSSAQVAFAQKQLCAWPPSKATVLGATHPSLASAFASHAAASGTASLPLASHACVAAEHALCPLFAQAPGGGGGVGAGAGSRLLFPTQPGGFVSTLRVLNQACRAMLAQASIRGSAAVRNLSLAARPRPLPTAHSVSHTLRP